MYHLTGEYECKMDAKGRIKLPAALVRQLESGTLTFFVNRGMEKCLSLFTKKTWEAKMEQIGQLNPYDPKHRQFIRFFQRGATEVVLDSSGRLLIPKHLHPYAGIKKTIVLSGILNYVEIWSKENYGIELENEPEDFSALAQEVFGNTANDYYKEN